MYKHFMLTAGTALALLFATEAARAQAPGLIANERWICTDKAPTAQSKPVEYLVKDGALIEQPLGVPRYRLLTDTMYGMVGVDFSTDLELGYEQPYVATVLIDRASGDYTYTHGSSGGAPEARIGKCHMVKTLGPTAQK